MRAVKCPRCNAVCLLAMVEGFKAAVDPTPLGAVGVRAVLVAGRSVYAPRYGFKTRQCPTGRLRGLALLTASTLGAHIGLSVLGEHACGNGAFSGVPIDAPEVALSAPVCDLRRRGGWTPPASCPRAVAERTGVPVVVSSCEACDPPPFDLAELGAIVREISVKGRVVYRNE